MTVAISSSETSALTGATRRNIPEDTILHSHRRENLYTVDIYVTWVSVVGHPCVPSTSSEYVSEGWETYGFHKCDDWTIHNASITEQSVSLSTAFIQIEIL
jgi:hypothetical protein